MFWIGDSIVKGTKLMLPEVVITVKNCHEPSVGGWFCSFECSVISVVPILGQTKISAV